MLPEAQLHCSSSMYLNTANLHKVYKTGFSVVSITSLASLDTKIQNFQKLFAIHTVTVYNNTFSLVMGEFQEFQSSDFNGIKTWEPES